MRRQSPVSAMLVPAFSHSEQYFEVATWVIEAAVLLPGEPEVRTWASEARPLLEELRAKPYLDKLDEALASAPSAESAMPTESRARTV